MELTVQQPCPTCGAEILINEDDRLIQCEYCDVHNYMVHRELARFALPARLPSHVSEERLFYVPYLRFKGTIYYCQGLSVHNKMVDTTRVGFPLRSLPVSLGLRPQVMHVLPVTSQTAGNYVRQTIKAKTIFSDAARLTTLFNRDKKEDIVHRAFIGETISRVYLPLYAYHGFLYDGVTHTKIGPSSLVDKMMESRVKFHAGWEPRFLSTICPGCGDTMVGSRDTLVMRCNNCVTCWREVDGQFRKIDFGVVESSGGDAIYLPFWYIEPEVDGYKLHSLGDYLEFVNHPVVITGRHRQKKLAFIIPAFKVTPNTYLQAAKNLTAVQLAFTDEQQIPLTTSYPVTMPFTEAVQSLKSVLAGAAVSPKMVFGILDKLTFKVGESRLLYLPFQWIGRDIRQERSGFSFSSAALRYGRSL